MTLDKILGQVWSQRKSDAPKGARGDPPRVPPQRHGRPGGIEGSAYMTDNWVEAFEAALAGTSSGTAAGSTRSCWDGVSSGRTARS